MSRSWQRNFTFGVVFALFALVLAPIAAATGPTFPPQPWDGVTLQTGPTFPPQPWDGLA